MRFWRGVPAGQSRPIQKHFGFDRGLSRAGAHTYGQHHKPADPRGQEGDRSAHRESNDRSAIKTRGAGSGADAESIPADKCGQNSDDSSWCHSCAVRIPPAGWLWCWGCRPRPFDRISMPCWARTWWCARTSADAAVTRCCSEKVQGRRKVTQRQATTYLWRVVVRFSAWSSCHRSLVITS